MSLRTVDFLRAKVPTLAGTCLLVIGFGLMGASVWLNARWSAERDAAAARRTRAEVALKERTVAAKPAPLSADQITLQGVALQLRQPWLPALRVIESATEAPVYLLGLAIDPNTGIILLNAEAPSFAEALSYIAALNSEDLMGPAELRSHEQVVNTTGSPVVRFRVATRWIVR